jgi:mannose-6-phosphate isomerase
VEAQTSREIPESDLLSLRPIVLEPNQPVRPYRGGAGIARLRGGRPSENGHLAQDGADADRPEDFVGSTTAVLGSDTVGLTTLADGRTLADHIEADPVGFLGPDHIARYGADVGLLVKLINPGQRLFVHFHPDAAFAASQLGARHGKAEGWIIVDVDRPEAETSANGAGGPGDGAASDLVPAAADDAGYVYLGFRHDVDAKQVASWVSEQDVAPMLAALNRIAVRAGDTFFVPAGLPHAIGAGITAVELQEPTDFSIVLEWAGFDVPPEARHLGLGFPTALTALDRTGWDGDRLDVLREVRPTPHAGVASVFPAIADGLFRAERLRLEGDTKHSAGFAIIVVLHGDGVLTTDAGRLDLHRGMCVLVPYGVGDYQISGAIEAIRCLPPADTASELR